MRAAKRDKIKVVRSVNLPGETVCVDLFQRADGSYGYELFRRDSEDGRGWFAIGHYAAQRFETFDDATKAACNEVPWLADLL